jgi:hypothetical protein
MRTLTVRSGLVLACVALLTGGCAGFFDRAPRTIVETEIVEVPVPVYHPLPEGLLEGCPLPEISPEPLTNDGMLALLEELIETVIRDCNRRLSEIRDLQPENAQ